MQPEPLDVRHLDTLSEGLGDGTDLGAVLSVLVDDLRIAIPSFLGVKVTVPGDRHPVTLTTLDEQQARQVMSLLLVRLTGIGGPPITVVFYAAEPEDLTDLAGAARTRYDCDDTEIAVAQHEEPARPAAAHSVTGIQEAGIVNQAIGALIELGHTPEEALAVLHAVAARHHQSPTVAAGRFLQHLC